MQTVKTEIAGVTDLTQANACPPKPSPRRSLRRSEGRHRRVKRPLSESDFESGSSGARLVLSFTLIELIVVIAIIGILAAVAIPKYIDMSTRAKKAADDDNLGNLRTCTLFLYASNALAGSAVFPTESQVLANMSDPAEATNWKYYVSHTYNSNSGVWTVTEP